MTLSEAPPASRTKSKPSSDRMVSSVLGLPFIQRHTGKIRQSEQTERELLAAARAQAKQYPEIKHFEAIPGIGFIHAATISAILETPHRFADKKKVWMYAGLG